MLAYTFIPRRVRYSGGIAAFGSNSAGNVSQEFALIAAVTAVTSLTFFLAVGSAIGDVMHGAEHAFCDVLGKVICGPHEH